MLNFLAGSVLLYALSKEAFQRPDSDNRLSPPVNESARFADVLGNMHWGVFLAFVAAVAVWWLLERSTLRLRDPRGRREPRRRAHRGHERAEDLHAGHG